MQFSGISSKQTNDETFQYSQNNNKTSQTQFQHYRNNFIHEKYSLRMKEQQIFTASLILAIIMFFVSGCNQIPKSSHNLVQSKRQLQLVFQTTLLKQKVIYIRTIEDTQWLSTKSLKVWFEFTFHIGYKPQLSQIYYDFQNGKIWWENLPMQIIHIQCKKYLLQEQNGLFNSWSVIEASIITDTKADQLKKIAKQQTLRKIKNENKGSSIQQTIKSQLMALVLRNRQLSLSTKLLAYIDTTFNSIFSIPAKSQKKKLL